MAPTILLAQPIIICRFPPSKEAVWATQANCFVDLEEFSKKLARKLSFCCVDLFFFVGPLRCG